MSKLDECTIGGQFCAHRRIEYKLVEVGDELCCDSWLCKGCGMPFAPQAQTLVESLTSERDALKKRVEELTTERDALKLCLKHERDRLVGANDWAQGNDAKLQAARKLTDAVELLNPLREQLGTLLMDEDLTDDKLQEAAGALLPVLHDKIGMAQWKAREFLKMLAPEPTPPAEPSPASPRR